MNEYIKDVAPEVDIMDQTVNITMAEYVDLLGQSFSLQALESSGVDNWEWCGEHTNLYYEMVKDDQILREFLYD